MTCFADASLYGREVPTGLGELLERLGRFDALVEASRKSGGREHAAAIVSVHDELMDQARRLLPAGTEITEEAAEAAFFAGGLRGARYQETVLGEPPLVDTVGSETLHRFEVDVAADAVQRVHDAFGGRGSAEEEDAVQLQRELSDLALRREIMLALDALFPLVPGATTDADVWRLFSALYPDHPLRESEVQVVRTSTSLYFCIPFEDDRLQTRDDPVADRFIQSLTAFHPSYSAHFPSFGSLTAAALPPSLLDALAEQTALSRELLGAVLPTMVVVLPSKKVDQYIVHDAWGHGWQAHLFRFEETYRRVASYTDLPGLDEVFEREGVRVTLWEMLSRQVQHVVATGHVVAADFEPWLRASTAHRLYDALSGLNAEVLADVVEFKYIATHPSARELMPSSSFVPHLPTKLDLTIGDLSYYYERGLGAYRDFVTDTAAQERLGDALVARGLPEVPARQVVQKFTAALGPWLEKVHGRSVVAVRSAGGLQVNTFTRVALTYLSLHRALNDLYIRLMEERQSVSFADLLVFSSAAFLEADWRRNFWHLEAFLQQFEPLFVRYERAQASLDD